MAHSTNNFNYDAPNFFDFALDNPDNHYEDKAIKEFFEVKHENHLVNDSVDDDDDNQSFDINEFYTPLKKTPQRKGAKSTNLRRSSSVSKIYDDKKRKEQNGQNKRKVYRETQKYSSIDDLTLKKDKYVSMAEAVRQFHARTPARFHSRGARNESTIQIKQPLKPLQLTIPQSPRLTTKQRIRPINVMSREEMEFQEFLEARKHQIKANPIRPKILSGEAKPSAVIKKTPTKIEPFNLTQTFHKVLPPPSPPAYVFHAKPILKSLYEAPKPILKGGLLTKPITPNMIKRHQAAAIVTKNEAMTSLEDGNKTKSSFKLTTTHPAPFSFESRDKGKVKQREKLLDETLEQEKKARQFRAKPLPKYISSSLSTTSTSISTKQKSVESLNDRTSSAQFKARPAKVLQTEPFVVKRTEVKAVEFNEFQLNTEKRAKERLEFEKRKQEKEENIAKIMKERQEEIIRKEEEEINRLRKVAVHKACPIRRYKDVPPAQTKELTVPETPNFTRRKDRSDSENKENVSDIQIL